MPSLKPVIKLGNKTAAEQDMKKPAAAATEDDQKPRVYNIHELQQETCAATASVMKKPTSKGDCVLPPSVSSHT
jgi:hypothetical protein